MVKDPDHIPNYFSRRSSFFKDINNFGMDWTDGPETTIMHMARNHFKSLCGVTLEFYGADTGAHTFKIDNIVFRVLEDPEDGYRSCLGTLDYTDDHNSIFFNTPISRVKIQPYTTMGSSKWDSSDENELVGSGYRLVDEEDSHIWLEFGTDYSDDYYPYFLFRYYPKPPVSCQKSA